ncbi:MAG: HlyD family secretion protein [Ignavibacteriales bacterium]|nr:HlyD family secretion protein [Ignavibacteriales bacterium]
MTNPDIKNEEEEQSIDAVPIYRKMKIVIPFMLLIIITSAGVWKLYQGSLDFVNTDDAFIDCNRITVSAKILGRITAVAVNEGDSVARGSVLVRLDDSDLRAQEAQSRAACILAEENQKLTGVSLSKAQDDFKRSEKQFREGIVTREQFDHAQNELEAARSRQAIAGAQIATAHAQLGVIETQLLNTVIRSPMDGTVSKRWALAGDVVQPAQPILSIYSLDSVWVTANLEETKISALKAGDTASIGIDAYPDAGFHGMVLQLGTNTAAQFSLIPPNNAAGNFTKVTQRIPVKLSVTPDQVRTKALPLLPGMSVEVSIKVR